MSHDIRTPLNGIIGLLKIDEEHFDDEELVKENHEKMKVVADHLLSLINDILQMSKLEEGNIALKHEQICLQELMNDIETITISRAVSEGIKWEYEKKKTDFSLSLYLRKPSSYSPDLFKYLRKLYQI